MIFTEALKELTPLRQWVAFRKVPDPKLGKVSKPPINIRTGKGEGWNNPENMGTYEEAYHFAIMHTLICSVPSMNTGGIGFVFTENDCYCGIDLDDVIDAEGKLTPEAEDIVALMDTYTEYSLSGKGLHILFKLSQPLDSFGFKITHKLPLGVASRIELYDRNKFFTVSNKPFGEVKPIAERTEQCKQLCIKYLTKPAKATVSTPEPTKKSSIADWKYNPDNYNPNLFSPVDTRTRSEDLSDSELWQRMFDSQNGADIQALYRGDISGYGSDHSRADLALCSYLAYWTNGDTSRIDRMFRQSGLMRDKWERKDYRESTIAKALSQSHAINSTGNYSDAPINGNSPHENITQTDSESNHREETLHDPLHSHLADYLDYAFLSDIHDFALYKNRKTGFTNFDRDNALYPGLYVIGGVSGVGKTTFCHQIADNLARAGEYVLYFTLEQPRFELASKGIARITAQENPAFACTALEIRNGKGINSEAVQRAIRIYKSFADHEYIIECGFDTSVDTVIQQVKDFIKATGKKPFVLIDYLQILKPTQDSVIKHKSSKEAVDDTVHALKKLQADNSLVIFVISSFNRQNYLAVADFEAFKESGLIEYSADCVMALQLLAMNADLLDTQNKLMAKRDFVHVEKKKRPRDIELLILKNRYGPAFARYFFEYDARYDLFTPNDISAEQADTLIQARAKPFEEKHTKKKKDSTGEQSKGYQYGEGY